MLKFKFKYKSNLTFKPTNDIIQKNKKRSKTVKQTLLNTLRYFVITVITSGVIIHLGVQGIKMAFYFTLFTSFLTILYFILKIFNYNSVNLQIASISSNVIVIVVFFGFMALSGGIPLDGPRFGVSSAILHIFGPIAIFVDSVFSKSTGKFNWKKVLAYPFSYILLLVFNFLVLEIPLYRKGVYLPYIFFDYERVGFVPGAIVLMVGIILFVITSSILRIKKTNLTGINSCDII